MTSMTGTLAFTDGGRAYTCRVETPQRGRADAWWWFAVTGDDARYAPFRADADDTPDSVQPRVVAYYEDRIARRGGAPWKDRGDDPRRDVVTAGSVSEGGPSERAAPATGSTV